MEPIYDYTIKLIRYALNGDVPELPDDIDFERLFTFGKSHGVENMLYIGLHDLNIAVPEDTMKKFKKAYEMAIMLEAKQAFELEAIGGAFEEAGIDYVPLKGSVIKYLYPMPDYRKSGDIDILIRRSDEPKIDAIMKTLGYEHDTNGDYHEYHFEYNKPPFIKVEIHRCLLHETDRAYKFAETAWQHAILKDGSKHEYSLEDEFIYTYLLAHFKMHLSLGGAGMRMVCDLHMVRSRLSMDYDLINKYMMKTKQTDINNMLTGLVLKWFGTGYEPQKNVEVLEKIVLTGGSFGTPEIRKAMKSSSSGMDKAGWLVRRILPPRAVVKYRYPIVEKRPYLLPFVWIYRFIDLLFLDRGYVKEKMDEKFNEETRIEGLDEIIKAIGTLK